MFYFPLGAIFEGCFPAKPGHRGLAVQATWLGRGLRPYSLG